MSELTTWEKIFESEMSKRLGTDDPAHDILHLKRVVQTAKQIANAENAKLEVVVPAAWLHDFVNVKKDSPLRSKASKLSAEEAINFLTEIKYPKEFYDEIFHAIEAHSFSANIETKTIEAKIVQDADRLDGLGAVGIARCFTVATILKRPFYSSNDPFCDQRLANDNNGTIDHFFTKLFKTVDMLKTDSGKQEGIRRLEYMKSFLNQLKSEIL